MHWIRAALTASLVCLFVLRTPAQAQNPAPEQSQPIVVRPIQVPDWPNSIEAFTRTPPDITLVPRGEGARHGQIWIRSVREPSRNYGLWIAGKVDGPQPDFALSKDVLPSKDHIEIWLAASRDVDLPEIGWNDHGQAVTLPQGAASCEGWAGNINQEVAQMGGSKDNPYLARLGGAEGISECQAWAASQARYREYFKRLFVRQWLVGPKQQIETFATPASEHISDWYINNEGSFGPPPQFMMPQSWLQISMFPEASGYSFAVFVPYPAFPPLPSLETSELYVLVDVFNAASAGKKMGAYSTSSSARVWGKPSTFNALRLDPPFSFPLTPCKLPFEQGADEREKRLMWVLPNLSYSPEELSDTFELVQNENEWGGTEPQGRSPDVRTHHHFSRFFPLGPGKDNSVWVCGPDVGIARGGATKSFSEVISGEVLELKQMPDGHLLLKVGPEVGSVGQSHGNCGAAPKNDLRIFDVDKDLDLRPAIALGDVICGPLLSQDFTISPDWSQITEYDDNQTDDNSDSWTATTYCRKFSASSGYNYEPCGTKQNVQPPNPPVLKELRR